MRENHIYRKDQIVDRGKVYSEMGEGHVSLAGRHGKTGLLHLVEHLGEDPEVKAGSTKSKIA